MLKGEKCSSNYFFKYYLQTLSISVSNSFCYINILIVLMNVLILMIYVCKITITIKVNHSNISPNIWKLFNPFYIPFIVIQSICNFHIFYLSIYWISNSSHVLLSKLVSVKVPIPQFVFLQAHLLVIGGFVQQPLFDLPEKSLKIKNV